MQNERQYMTTEQAFDKLMNTKCWCRLVGVTAQFATAIKQEYKKNAVKLDSMTGYLTRAGAVYDVEIVSPQGDCFYEYKDAFGELLKTPDIWMLLEITIQNYYALKNRYYNNPALIKISTMHKHLSKAGYKITMNWHLPPEIK